MSPVGYHQRRKGPKPIFSDDKVGRDWVFETVKAKFEPGQCLSVLGDDTGVLVVWGGSKDEVVEALKQSVSEITFGLEDLSGEDSPYDFVLDSGLNPSGVPRKKGIWDYVSVSEVGDSVVLLSQYIYAR